MTKQGSRCAENQLSWQIHFCLARWMKWAATSTSRWTIDNTHRSTFRYRIASSIDRSMKQKNITMAIRFAVLGALLHTQDRALCGAHHAAVLGPFWCLLWFYSGSILVQFWFHVPRPLQTLSLSFGNMPAWGWLWGWCGPSRAEVNALYGYAT